MTLNITIVSPAGIHQSADFRISKTDKDENDNWIELQPNSSKIVSLLYQKWFGFMTYCGIGLWNGKRTDEYAVEWLAETTAKDPSFRDVVERVRDRGSNWLNGINRGRKSPFSHSFVLAGYEDGLPIYAVVSNAQSLTNRFPALSTQLVSEIRATKDLHLLITGIPEAVSETSQLRLKYVVRSGAAPNVVRYEMAEVNRIASECRESKNGISPGCFWFSINSAGAGHGELYGEVAGPVMPRSVFGGVDMGKMLTDVLSKIPNAKLVQAAYATSQSNRQDVEENIECHLEFNKVQTSTVEEIVPIKHHVLSPQAVNDDGWIVGHLINPFNAFLYIPEHDMRVLGTFGGPFSHAFAINEKNKSLEALL